MELFKIIVIAVAGVVMIVLVKQYRPEYAALIRIAAGLVIFFLIAGQLSGIVSGIEGLISLCGYNRDYARVLMKGREYAFRFSSARTHAGTRGKARLQQKSSLRVRRRLSRFQCLFLKRR